MSSPARSLEAEMQEISKLGFCSRTAKKLVGMAAWPLKEEAWPTLSDY